LPLLPSIVFTVIFKKNNFRPHATGFDILKILAIQMVPADLEPTLLKLQCSGEHQIAHPQKIALSEKGTELGKVIAAWPDLPESVRASISFLVGQFVPDSE
jgi:hypothetical protein